MVEARIRVRVWLGIEHNILVWWIPEYEGDSLTNAQRERERNDSSSSARGGNEKVGPLTKNMCHSHSHS